MLIAYFLTFLMAPIMTLLEVRPCVVQDQMICQVSTTRARIKVHGTAKAELYDLVHSCKFPHSVSVLATLLVCILALLGIGAIGLSEFFDIVGDETFMYGFDLLMLDGYEFLSNVTGMEMEQEVTGYYNAELVSYGMLFQNVAAQTGLVLMLTVLIMGNFSVDDDSRRGVGVVASQIHDMMKYYINLKTQLSLLTGGLTGVILLLCQVKLAIMFGILAFLLNFIPNFGSIIAMLLPVPIILVDDNLSPQAKLLAIILPALVQGAIGNVLEPAVFGSSLNMTPISILMALVTWASLWCVDLGCT